MHADGGFMVADLSNLKDPSESARQKLDIYLARRL